LQIFGKNFPKGDHQSSKAMADKLSSHRMQ